MNQYSIRLAGREDLALLGAIERAAAELFPENVISPEAKASVVPPDQLAEALVQHRLWVAVASDRQPVGFSMVVSGKNTAFLSEVDVHPEHQRKGLGRALVLAAVSWAEAKEYPRITLTTFRDLPWNAPFYERLGFRRIAASELTEDLAWKLCDEKNQGLRGRVAMELLLSSPNNFSDPTGFSADAPKPVG